MAEIPDLMNRFCVEIFVVLLLFLNEGRDERFVRAELHPAAVVLPLCLHEVAHLSAREGSRLCSAAREGSRLCRLYNTAPLSATPPDCMASLALIIK